MKNKNKINLNIFLSVSAFFVFVMTGQSFAETSVTADESSVQKTESSETTGKSISLANGLTKGYQALPNSMTRLCQTEATVMSEDRLMVEKCLQIIASKINAEMAPDRLAGAKIYNEIRLEQLSSLISETTAKSAAQQENVEIQNKLTQTTDKVSTDHDMMNAVSYDMLSLAKTVNNIQDILAESIKYEMLNEVKRIDAASWSKAVERRINTEKSVQKTKAQPEEGEAK